MNILKYVIIGLTTFAGSFATTSFTLGQYKSRFEAVEANASATSRNLDSLRLEVTDRLGRIEQKLDDVLGEK